MSKVTHGKVFQVMENWAPVSFASDWDNVGLQIGSKYTTTTKVLTTLDVTEKIVDEAISLGANLIIAHHPTLFKPLKSIDFDTPKGKLIKKLIKHDITVYASHTNLDIAPGGVNDLLSEAIALQNVAPLIETVKEKLYKIAVYVPVTHVSEVVDALSNAGAGHIGNYSHCTFQSPGTGTFMPLEGTKPFIGTQYEIEKVDEIKIETIVKEKALHKTIKKMVEVHPYEEVAYDVYPLVNSGAAYGLGRIGELATPMALAEFASFVKKQYKVPHLRVVGDETKQIKKVAVLGGSGESYVNQAIAKGADVLITGDVTFHNAQDAEEAGFSIIDPGHHIEQIMKKATKQYIEQNFPTLQVVESKISSEPFYFI